MKRIRKTVSLAFFCFIVLASKVSDKLVLCALLTKRYDLDSVPEEDAAALESYREADRGSAPTTRFPKGRPPPAYTREPGDGHVDDIHEPPPSYPELPRQPCEDPEVPILDPVQPPRVPTWKDYVVDIPVTINKAKTGAVRVILWIAMFLALLVIAHRIFVAFKTMFHIG